MTIIICNTDHKAIIIIIIIIIIIKIIKIIIMIIIIIITIIIVIMIMVMIMIYLLMKHFAITSIVLSDEQTMCLQIIKGCLSIMSSQRKYCVSN